MLKAYDKFVNPSKTGQLHNHLDLFGSNNFERKKHVDY